MGLESYITAIGPYNPRINDCLGYTEQANVGTARSIIIDLMECPTSSMSKELAAALDIEPFDFGVHQFDYEHVLDRTEQLSQFARDYAQNGMLEELRKLLKLAGQGFEFFYRPNG